MLLQIYEWAAGTKLTEPQLFMAEAVQLQRCHLLKSGNSGSDWTG
jgi:hypothetical protein